ncbi:MAG TPA: DUF692 family protein [Thermoanaerobaculia bacterium]|nr:DUF692 family protein [Thermoanaerobaculia bacterium]
MRYGLGWRPELAAGILGNLDRIDVIEILAEEHFDAGPGERRALRFLRTQVPVVLHATSLGLASTEPVDGRRLDAIARVVEWLQPDFWSEHLAFVRAGGREIGHLAAPPRNDATLEGLARNVALATRLAGSPPLLENVASLIDPLFSTYDEASWLRAVLDATPCDLLLDLHNLHANAVNFRFDPRDVLRTIPHERIGAVHLAGGRRIEGNRLLDDHLHAVPDPVYELLAEVHPEHATVILERDGHYPPIDELLRELDRARAVRSTGVPPPAPAASATASPEAPLDTIPFLAALYADPAARAAFLQAPYETALAAGFAANDAATLSSMNAEDLAVAGRGFDAKRGRVGSRRF